VVTAIEVIEHVVDPVPALKAMADLLRPGGLLFLTTGNAAPHADGLSRWSYVRPEIHVSFFEPRTLAEALRRVGLEPAFPGFVPGWEDIVKFKILKNLHRRRALAVDRLLPWGVLSRLAHKRAPVSAHPVGRKPGRSVSGPQGFD
jgi:SAM-dependent methyltransferase